MNRFLAGLAAATVLTGLAGTAQAAPAVFAGRLIITGSAGTCDYDPTGSRINARWMPANTGSNPGSSTLSLFRKQQATNYTLDGAKFDAKLRTVSTMVINNFADPQGNVVKVSFNSIAPGTVTADTPAVNIVGKISGFDYMPACVVSFRLAAVNRVD